MEIIIIFFGLYVGLKLTDHFLASKGYKGPESDHFNGTVFYSYGTPNPLHSGKPAMSKRSIWKWLLTRKRNVWRWHEIKTLAKPRERVAGDELVVTLVNHATLLIQTQGLNILTGAIPGKARQPVLVFWTCAFPSPRDRICRSASDRHRAHFA